MLNASDTRERIHLTDEFLRSRGRNGRPDARVGATVKNLANGVEVGRVAHIVGLSARQLERQFLTRVGIGPKTLARLARFQRALRCRKNDHRPTWAAVAAECGYADQSHLIADFRQFAGLCPSDLVWRESELATHLVRPAES